MLSVNDFSQTLERNLSHSELMHVQSQLALLTRKCNAKCKEHATLQARIEALEKQCKVSRSFSFRLTRDCKVKYATLKTIVAKQNEEHHHNITLTTATVLQECYRLKEQIDVIQHQLTALQSRIVPSHLVRLPPIVTM